MIKRIFTKIFRAKRWLTPSWRCRGTKGTRRCGQTRVASPILPSMEPRPAASQRRCGTQRSIRPRGQDLRELTGLRSPTRHHATLHRRHRLRRRVWRQRRQQWRLQPSSRHSAFRRSQRRSLHPPTCRRFQTLAWTTRCRRRRRTRRSPSKSLTTFRQRMLLFRKLRW